MPSSYTTSLRLTLPATGELSGQWGNTVNTGITELLDAAVAGTATISSWGGAGVSYTLSNNSGTADEARKMFIVATGSPGEAKNVICPAVSKFYVFRNDTTGGYALTLKTPTGTGISVPAGQYRFLYCDGTNVVETFNSVAALTVIGALNAGTIAATTLDLTNLEVTNIKAKDGTASMTLADATGVATFSANPVLNAGTANSVLYLNGSKVATSGSALTFDGTNLGIGTSSPVTALNFQAGATISWGTSLLSIDYVQAGSGSVAIGTNGSEKAVINSSGNLGLGVTPSGWGTTPKALQVGTVSSFVGAGLTFGTNVGYNYFTDNLSDKYIQNGFASVYNQRSGEHRWFTAPSGTAGNAISFTQAMTLDSSGNLGLGVTPSAWGSSTKSIDLNTGGAIYAFASNSVGLTANAFYNGTNWIYKNSSSAASLYTPTNGQHQWFTAPSGTAGNAISFTQAMTLDSSGNLGLGVTPSAWGSGYKAIDIGVGSSLWAQNTGSAATFLSANVFYNGASFIYKASNFSTYYLQNSGNGQHQWYTAPSGTAGNAITFTQAMTLDANGNLKVNGVVDSFYTGTTAGSQLGSFRLYGTGAGVTGEAQVRAVLDTGSITAASLQFYTGTTERARITSGGNLLVGLTSSDAKFHVTNGASPASRLIVGGGGGAAGTLYSILSAGDYVGFETNGSERARITSGGDLLVGTTDAGATSGVGFKVTSSTTIPGTFTVFNTAGGGNTYHLYNTNATNNGYRFYVSVNGGVNNYSGNNVNLSDIRRKKNIEVAGDYLDKICAIPVKLFNYIDEPEGEQRTLGVIAQDVEAVAPELVSNEGFGETPEGETPLKTIYTVDIQFALMKCIQEQQALITALTARVTALESN